MTHDPVNNPAHYTQGRRFDVIEVLEDWVVRAPGPVEGGLQWNVCKYLGRLWDKQNALQDARKSRWYLDRLIALLEKQEQSFIPPKGHYKEVSEDSEASAGTYVFSFSGNQSKTEPTADGEGEA